MVAASGFPPVAAIFLRSSSAVKVTSVVFFMRLCMLWTRYRACPSSSTASFSRFDRSREAFSQLTEWV